METKKNPSKDLTLQRKKFFMIGLSIALALVITAFEWTTEKKKIVTERTYEQPTDVSILVPATTIDYPKPPELKLEKMKIETKPIVPIEFKIVESGSSEELSTFTNDPELATGTESVTILEKPEETDSIFVVAEFQPEPKNGYANFYKELGEKIKYPMQAKRTATEGKVYVQFVISKTGEPTDLKVIRGIGAGCDEEAMRVLSLTKWEPGKQRGRPVRVKMSMPLNFKLN